MRYSFANFELDDSLYELRRSGARIELRRQLFDLLLHLIRHRDRVVSREELITQLWRGRNIGQTSLATCVSALRRIVGNEHDGGPIIETVRGRGYRFVPVVQEILSPSDLDAEPLRRSSISAVFVGREHVLGQLAEALVDSLTGHGRLVLLTGEPGIGKTRTAERLAELARQRDFRVLIGRCREDEGAPAFWPWIQMIRADLEERGPELVGELLGRGLADVARIVPELQAALPGLPALSPLDAAEARFRLFDVLAGFLEKSARQQPLALILDDLHRADLPSLRLLKFLASELTDSPVLIAATYRSRELQQDPARRGEISDLGRTPGSIAILLEGLAKADINRLVTETTGWSLGDSAVALLQEWTGGNPFFLTQIVPRLADLGALGVDGIDEIDPLALPLNVRDAVARQLDGLPSACREALRVAAVIGKEFSANTLAAARGHEEGAVLDLLNTARDGQILLDCPGGLHRYRFAHVLVREVLYAEIPEHERKRLHGLVGMALESLHGADLEPHLVEIAHHLVSALPNGDLAKAVDYCVQSARAASARLAWEESARHYLRALEVLDAPGPAWDVQRCDLLLDLAEAQVRAGDRATSRETCWRAAALARRIDAPERMARSGLALSPGLLSIESGVHDADLVALLEESLAALGERDDPLRARLLCRLAIALYWSHRDVRRAELSSEALAIAQRSGDQTTLAHALGARHAALWTPENIGERLDLATKIVRIAEETGDRETSLMYRVFRITDLLELGSVAEVDAEIAHFAQMAEDLRQPQSQWYALMFRSMRALMSGRFDEVEPLASQFLGLGQRLQERNALQAFGAHVCLRRIERGELDGIPELLRDYAYQNPGVAVWRGAVAWACAEAGRADEARREVEQLCDSDFAAVRRDMNWLATLAAVSDACAYLGDGLRAPDLYNALLPYGDRNVVVGFGSCCFGSASRYLGLLAATRGHWDVAVHHFEDAMAMNDRMGARPALARSQQGCAEALRARGRPGDRERGLALASEALSTARELGMGRLANRLARLVQPPPFQGPGED